MHTRLARSGLNADEGSDAPEAPIDKDFRDAAPVREKLFVDQNALYDASDAYVALLGLTHWRLKGNGFEVDNNQDLARLQTLQSALKDGVRPTGSRRGIRLNLQPTSSDHRVLGQGCGFRGTSRQQSVPGAGLYGADPMEGSPLTEEVCPWREGYLGRVSPGWRACWRD